MPAQRATARVRKISTLAAPRRQVPSDAARTETLRRPLSSSKSLSPSKAQASTQTSIQLTRSFHHSVNLYQSPAATTHYPSSDPTVPTYELVAVLLTLVGRHAIGRRPWSQVRGCPGSQGLNLRLHRTPSASSCGTLFEGNDRSDPRGSMDTTTTTTIAQRPNIAL